MHEHQWQTDLDRWGNAVCKHRPWAATALSHGMCSPIHEILRAQCSLGSTVCASPTPRYTGLTKLCPLFGALPQWGWSDHNTAPHSTEPTEPLPYTKVYIHTQMTTVIPSQLPELLTAGDHSVIILHNRDHYTSTTPRDTVTHWPTMLHHYADQGRGHMLAHWNKLRCKKYYLQGLGNEVWHHVTGVWELWLIQGGTADVGWDLDAPSLSTALHNLTKRTAPYAGFDLPPSLAAHIHDIHKHVAKWWRLWHHEVDTRNALIKHTPTPHRLYRSNTLLLTTPDRKMQRAVRLSCVGVQGCLTSPSKGIYALLSSSFLYIGQYGCINGPRPPFACLRDHYAKGKSVETTSHIPMKRHRPPHWERTPFAPETPVHARSRSCHDASHARRTQ